MAAASQVLFQLRTNPSETKHPVHLIHREMFCTIYTRRKTLGQVDYTHLSHPCLKQPCYMVKASHVVHSNLKSSFIRIDCMQKQTPKKISFHLLSYKGFWAFCYTMGCPGLTGLNMSPTIIPKLNNLTSFVRESPASHKSPPLLI